MWEKLSDYFLDISKYLITATFITTFVGDMGEELHWLIYLVSFILAAGLFGFALYFDKKGKKEKQSVKNIISLIIKIGGCKYEHFNIFRHVCRFLWCYYCYTFVSLGTEMDE